MMSERRPRDHCCKKHREDQPPQPVHADAAPQGAPASSCRLQAEPQAQLGSDNWPAAQAARSETGVGRVTTRPFSPETLAERWACSTEKIPRMLHDGEHAGFTLGKLNRIPAVEASGRAGRDAEPLMLIYGGQAK